jgi:hypothetical protein
LSAKSSACLVSSSTLFLSYLLFELLDIAKLLRFYFIARDDLYDFLNLRQRWLRGV